MNCSVPLSPWDFLSLLSLSTSERNRSTFACSCSTLIATVSTFEPSCSTFSQKFSNFQTLQPPYFPYKTKKASRKPTSRFLNALYVYMNLAIKLLQRFLVTLLLLNRCARSLHLEKLVFCGNPHSHDLNGVT